MTAKDTKTDAQDNNGLSRSTFLVSFYSQSLTEIGIPVIRILVNPHAHYF